jgi:hypothetical protein
MGMNILTSWSAIAKMKTRRSAAEFHQHERWPFGPRDQLRMEWIEAADTGPCEEEMTEVQRCS